MRDENHIKCWSMDRFLGHLCGQLQARRGHEPLYTLIVGAGFSSGVIPTTLQMVLEDIPWWLYTQQSGVAEDYKQSISHNSKFTAFTTHLWKSTQSDVDVKFQLDNENIPSLSPAGNISNAYQSIMLPEASRGLSRGDMRRNYLRDVMRKAGDRVNAAHLFLAGILAAQEQWNDKAPFCRTVFTTNFDPLLQRSLQLTNVLYTLTDRPHELELPDDLDHSAVHLVYAHGTVYQHILLNTDAEIASAKSNAEQIKSYLRRKGVIVIGYGGWPDAVMDALTTCNSYDGNLFWCDRHPPDSLDGRLRRDVRELLESKRSSAYYIQIPSADELMLELHDRLGLGRIPALLLHPINRLRQQIGGLHLSGLSLSRPPKRQLADADEMTSSTEDARNDSLDDFRELLLRRLELAEQTSRISALEDPAKAIDAIRENLIGEASVATTNGDDARAIALLSRIIDDSSSTPLQRSKSLFRRAISYGRVDNRDAERADYDALVTMPNASMRYKAMSLVNRGVIKGASGDSRGELEDYDTVLSMVEAPVSQRARALNNRGLTICAVDGDAAAIADFDQVLGLPNVPLVERGRALMLRARSRRRMQDLEGALIDYETIASIKDLPTHMRSQALFHRGLIRVGAEDFSNALLEFNSLLASPELPRDLEASALCERGRVLDRLGDAKGALADWGLALELTGTSPRIVNRLRNRRGLLRGRLGDAIGESEDASAVLSEAESDSRDVGLANINGGASFFLAGDIATAVKLLTTAAAYEGNFPELIAMSDLALGVVHLESGNSDKAEAHFRKAAAFSELKAHGELAEVLLASLGGKGQKHLPKDVATLMLRLELDGSLRRMFEDYLVGVESSEDVIK